MQYLLQIYTGDGEAWDRLSADEQEAIMGEYFAISTRPRASRAGPSSSLRRRRPPCASRTGRR